MPLVAMQVVWTILLVLLLIIAALVFYVIGSYNSMVRMRNTLQESWRQIDVELNRRYDLIPNLVETVKGYAKHESGTLENVVKLRNQAAALSQAGANQEQRSNVEQQLSTEIHNLMVQVEAYPDLKANVNFLELQRELVETEDRIAAGRRFYNANVRSYNTKIQSFPSSLIATRFNFTEGTYFEINDPVVRQAPNVKFEF